MTPSNFCPKLYWFRYTTALEDTIGLLVGKPLFLARGPHRYTRTVRVPILRPKIPVKKRIISNRYFGTGTMTEKSAETRDRRENTSRIRDRVIRLSCSIYLRSRDRGIGGKIHRKFVIASSVFPARSTYDHVIGGDIWDHILSCIFVVKKVTGIGTVRIPEPYKKYRNRTVPYNFKDMDPYS